MSLKNKPKNNNVFRYIFVGQWVILSIVIFYLSHQNTIYFLPQRILEYDKLLHFVAYFIYGLSTLSMLVFVKKTDKRVIVIGLIVSVLFAISDEIHQFFVPNRMMDIYDLFADLLGILSSILFFNLILKNRLLQLLNFGKK